MEHTPYASRLRYLDADDVDDSVVDFDGLHVRDTADEKLGDLDGFLVEPSSGRLLYLVVDSGGWFTSRRLLVPAEHATVDRNARSLRVNTSRESLKGYPEFDEDRFARLSDDEFHTYHGRLHTPWAASGALGSSVLSGDTATSYRDPDWWSANAYRPERLRPIESRSFGRRSATRSSATPPTRTSELHDRDLVTARSRDDDTTRRDADDVSPHPGGRAQPGDVLGIETGGETTGIGDTAEDEDKRRRTTERTERD